MPRHPVAVVVLAALAVGGCGGDGGLSADEYRAQARRICAEADRATRAVEEPTRVTSSSIVDYFERLLRANDRTTKRFQALDPPDELRRAHDAALEANAGAIREVRRVIAQLEQGGDPREVLTAARPRLARLGAQANDAARRIGAPACADR